MAELNYCPKCNSPIRSIMQNVVTRKWVAKCCSMALIVGGCGFQTIEHDTKEQATEAFNRGHQ